jgi:hypothetical protein
MFVEIETKSEELLLINSEQVSFIRVGLDSKGLPRAIVFFGAGEPLELSVQDGHPNQMRSCVEFDNVLELLTGMQGRF